MTMQYIHDLVVAYPSVREVWLFGSRANGTAHDGSDWDYLVFGDDDMLMSALCRDLYFNKPEIDLFVVVEPMRAMKPWHNKSSKVLDLSDEPGAFGWRVVSDREARYTATKKRDPRGFNVEMWEARAVRVYRRGQ